ncbi:hypothetical protein QYM36_011572 [Artemia franciscana]|nr:hypothetical protein QYM36_011572 [Artemia franciscana]
MDDSDDDNVENFSDLDSLRYLKAEMIEGDVESVKIEGLEPVNGEVLEAPSTSALAVPPPQHNNAARSLENSHCCTLCNKFFACRKYLVDHMRIHTQEKRHVCTFCDAKFLRRQHLNLHLTMHTGEKNFKCDRDQCGKAFARKARLDKHVKSHLRRENGQLNSKETAENVFHCEICGKDYITKYGYNVHMRMHTGKGLYECIICKRMFNRRYSLDQHVKIHTGERPFSCHICQKAFARTDALNGHMRRHMNIKPFNCTICSKGYTFKDKLKQHMNTHSTDKPFKCKLCGKTFDSSVRAKVHIDSRCCDKAGRPILYRNPQELNGSKDINEDKSSLESDEVDDSGTTAKNMTPDGPACSSSEAAVKLDKEREKLYMCNVCGQDFVAAEYIEAHFVSTHRDDKVSQDPKEDGSSLKSEEVDGSVDVVINDGGVCFSSENSAKLHKGGENLYMFNICGQVFVSAKNTAPHLASNNDDKSLQ